MLVEGAASVRLVGHPMTHPYIIVAGANSRRIAASQELRELRTDLKKTTGQRHQTDAFTSTSCCRCAKNQ
jgi:hypothetical protein